MSLQTVACPLCLAIPKLTRAPDIFVNGYVCGMLHTVEASLEKSGKLSEHMSDLITERFCERHALAIVRHIAVAQRVFAEEP